MMRIIFKIIDNSRCGCYESGADFTGIEGLVVQEWDTRFPDARDENRNCEVFRRDCDCRCGLFLAIAIEGAGVILGRGRAVFDTLPLGEVIG